MKREMFNQRIPSERAVAMARDNIARLKAQKDLPKPVEPRNLTADYKPVPLEVPLESLIPADPHTPTPKAEKFSRVF